MNRLLLRVALALCATTLPSLSAEGQGILFHEDFNDVTTSHTYLTSAGNSYKDWTIEGAAGGIDPESDYNNSKRVLIFNNSKGCYATTTALTELDGDAILTFRYYATTENLATFDVTINNGGVFEDSNTNTKSITTQLYHKYYTAVYRIKNGTAETTITFTRPAEGKSFCIDDVYVLSTTMPMTEAADNATTLKAYQGLTTDVTLTRTLKAGIWNTLCLPFDVSTTSFSKGNPQLRLFTSVTDNTLNFTEANEVEAGTPFLVKVDEDITNPTFSSVTMETSTPATITNSGVSLAGLFSPYEMATDGSELFLGIDGNLYQPGNTTNTIKGMRAILKATAGARMMTRIAGDETTRMDATRLDARMDKWYTTDGKELLKRPSRKGLYIGSGRKKLIIH